MRVALGTIEIADEHRKKIRKALGGKGHATRGEVKDFLVQALNDDVLPNVGEEQGGVQTLESSDETLPEPGSSASGTAYVSSAMG